MNDSKIDLCIEIHRYDKPENKYRFFWFTPQQGGSEIQLGAVLGHDVHFTEYPFETDDFEAPRGPAYAETGRQQLLEDAAEKERKVLDRLGYKPFRLEDVSNDLAQWVIHTQCPIEFHSMLDARDPDWTKRVTIWKRKR